MILHVRADHCADRTIDILEEWITHAVRKYREIDTKFVRTPERYEKSHKGSQFEKDEAIISHMIELKMEAIRDVIEKMLGLAGLKAQRVQGVDGKTLTEERMRQMGVKKVEGYLDSFHKRPITNGEIGCLISHHNIWKDVIKNDYSQVLILEDDAQLHPNFKGNLKQLLQEIKCIEWDLIFLGYKFVYQEGYHTEQVGDIRSLQTADYVYWAVGYLLSGTGAEKLVAANPLAHALPVDEFLPIMYDRTDLRFYKLDNGLYVSDTEETDVQESQVQISNLKKYESAKNAREKLAGPIGDDGKMEELSFSNERNKTTGLAWI
ncbi:hypothetical protein HAZT_HAZT004108 [Hyalella azteca]|uniref:Glycosyl transferase family 25 domain-containing protein n=1 Tax=Hyalella azteca TaxID=294128 RepID=A0A6A0GQG8_HYAAZ|nr:hypothetical protein HAZT_HAZT004108 [Hyalella azteca]